MQRRITWAVFAGFFALYALSLGRGFYSSDGEVMFLTTEALVKHHTLALAADPGLPQIVPGQGSYGAGRFYSKYDPGLPMLAIPFFVLGDWIADINAAHRHQLAAIFVLLLPVTGAAAALGGLARLLADWRVRNTAVVLLAAGLATPLWVYARTLFAEALLAGCLVWAVVLIYRAREQRFSWVIAGGVIGLGLVTRAAFGVYLPALMWLAVRRGRCGGPHPHRPPVGYPLALSGFLERGMLSGLCALKPSPPPTSGRLPPLPQGEGEMRPIRNLTRVIRALTKNPLRARGKRLRSETFPRLFGYVREMFFAERLRGLFWLGMGIAPFGALLLAHNWLRFGAVWHFGYADEGFTTLPWIGVGGLLFSPGKSVLVYAPPLLLSAVLWPRFRRVYPALGEFLLIAWGSALAFYGAWWAWHGGWCWGPRLLVPLLPLSCLPLITLPERGRWRALVGIVIGLGIGVQVLGVLADLTPYYALHTTGEVTDYAAVHYGVRHGVLRFAVEQVRAGQTEPLALFRLTQTGLPPTWTVGLPAGLALVGMLSVYRIVFAIKSDN